MMNQFFLILKCCRRCAPTTGPPNNIKYNVGQYTKYNFPHASSAVCSTLEANVHTMHWPYQCAWLSGPRADQLGSLWSSVARASLRFAYTNPSESCVCALWKYSNPPGTGIPFAVTELFTFTPGICYDCDANGLISRGKYLSQCIWGTKTLCATGHVSKLIYLPLKMKWM